MLITLDFPGHGKSSRMDMFEPDFWYYNSKVCLALLEKLEIDKVSVIGTSGGALTGINLSLEHPDRIKYLFADSFIGEKPSISFIHSLKEDRVKAKKNPSAQSFWHLNHGSDWENIIDLDTEMQIESSKQYNSYFHKPISQLQVPTYLTGSVKDEFFNNLDGLYQNIQQKNRNISIHLFKTGNHPALLSNASDYYQLVKKML